MSDDNKTLNSSGIDVSNIAESVLEKTLFKQEEKTSFDVNWATEFENGFLDYLELMINPDLKKGWYGLGAENRPKIVELNTKDNAQLKAGYRLIEFLPNHDVKTESYLFFGTPLELMTQICNFFNQWLLLKINSSNNSSSDMGVNIPKNKPLEGIYLKIYLCTKNRPPFYQHKSEKDKGEYFSIRYATIPVVNTSKLTYENLRTVCNDTNGQHWGRWSARAYVKSDLGIHQMVAGGDSEDVAIENLKKFLPLSNAVEFRPITTRHDYYNLSIPKRFKLYPAYIKVINYSHVINTDIKKQPGGINPISSKRIIKAQDINIYADKEPSWFSGKLRDVIRIKPGNTTK